MIARSTWRSSPRNKNMSGAPGESHLHGRLKPTITQTKLNPNDPGVLVVRGGEILQERRGRGRRNL